MKTELKHALQTIVDLTKDDDFICEKMSMTTAGSEWCRLNCGSRCGPDIRCCKEWIFNHYISG